jgi:thiamine-monophosphate kinase
LCFTAPASMRERIAAISEKEHCPITRIGRIIAEAGLYSTDDAAQRPVRIKGYDHFGVS